MNENLIQELQTNLWRLMRRIRQSAAPIEGLSWSAARVLTTAGRHCPESGVTPGRLAEKLAMATSNVAAALRELEHAGYIERQRAAHDGRRVTVMLTESGRSVITAQSSLRTDALRDVIQQALTADEQAQLAAAIPLLGRLGTSHTAP